MGRVRPPADTAQNKLLDASLMELKWLLKIIKSSRTAAGSCQ